MTAAGADSSARRGRSSRSIAVAAVCAGIAALTGVGAAHALWSADAHLEVGAARVGGVFFAAAASPDGTPAVSVGGEAVDVVLPGSVVAEALDADNVGQTIFWRFDARGAADGIAGLDYDVSVASQGTGTDAHDLADGYAQTGTVLAGSTLKVYRAAGGDCSTIPETATDAGDRNVHVFDADGVTLQTAGSNPDSTEIVQQWCVALRWNETPDGTYANGVTASATAEDGRQSLAIARWTTSVQFLPSLPPIGTYINGAVAEGIADDGSTARDDTAWQAGLYPDGSNEPDIVITLDPAVTSVVTDVDPAVAPPA